MKKSILISLAVMATLSVAALAFVNWDNQPACQEAASCNTSVSCSSTLACISAQQTELDLFYDVKNRWGTLTMEELRKAESLDDITSDRANGKVRDSFKNVWVAVLHNDQDVRDIETGAIGQSEVFDGPQIELLRSLDYSTNLRFTAISQIKDPNNGVMRDDSLVCYRTVIPERQADFMGGKEALIRYLRENTRDKASLIDKDKVQPAKVFFTVSKYGTIENVKLVDKSGYKAVDKELVKVISNMPQMWTPAQNAKGENVHQEFVFFFGSMGC